MLGYQSDQESQRHVMAQTSTTAPNAARGLTVGRIEQALREDIAAGALEPGERLDEVKLTERFGVSRTPVREALTRLTAQGVLAPGEKRGVRVAEYSREELAQMFEAMHEIESACARIASQRLTLLNRAEIEGAQKNCIEAAQAGELNVYLRANEAFHEAIYRATGNPYMAELASDFRRRTGIFFAYKHTQSHTGDPMGVQETKIYPINTGWLEADLGTYIFWKGPAGKKYWNPVYCHYVDTGEHKILIDTGLPDEERATKYHHKCEKRGCLQVHEHLEQKLGVAVEDECEVLPGITMYHTPGHSVGHMAVSVATAAGDISVVGDAIFVERNLDPNPAEKWRHWVPARFVNSYEGWNGVQVLLWGYAGWHSPKGRTCIDAGRGGRVHRQP